MKVAKLLMLAAIGAGLVTGCSEQTKAETKEAIKEAGEAARSAAQDTAQNVESAARTAREKLSGEPAETTPASEPTSP